MNESTPHDLHALHALIEAVQRSAPALDAALGAQSPQSVQARREAVAELEVEARRLENARREHGLLAVAHRVIEGLTSGRRPAPNAEGGGSLAALEAQETDLQARFDAVLADDRLSGPVRDAVLRAYDRVKEGQDAARIAWLAARGEV